MLRGVSPKPQRRRRSQTALVGAGWSEGEIIAFGLTFKDFKNIGLVSQHFFHFAVQSVRAGVDEFEIPLVNRLPLQLLEMVFQNFLNKRGAGAIGTDQSINLR
ncbi:MAG: hypothetical protein ABSC48_19795 [Terracidiphilus sp.]|jgi:hypothetical protein